MQASNIFKAASAFIAANIAAFFGGWTQLLTVLVVIVSIDIVTGVLAAFAEKKLSSKIGRKGIAGKVMIFLLVATGHFADIAMGTVETNLIMNAVIFFYLATELLSIIENSGRLGLPVPNALKQAIEILQNKSEMAKDDEDRS